jgi:hypothetical protein
LLQPLVTSSLFGPNIPLSTLFSNTLSLCSSLNVRDQGSKTILDKERKGTNFQCTIFELSVIFKFRVVVFWVMIPCSVVVDTQVSIEDTSANFRVECVHWLLLAQDKEKWQSLVSIVMIRIKF